MKKNFLRASAFAGLAVSVVVLASCGENVDLTTTGTENTTTEVLPTTTSTTEVYVPETVDILDVNGEVFTVSETKDADVVTKALLYSALAGLQNEKTPYAIGLDANLVGSVTVAGSGVTGTISADVNTAVKASIGEEAYTAYDLETATEEDFANALEELNRIAAVLTLNGGVKFTDFSIDEKDAFFTKHPGALEEIKASVEELSKEEVAAAIRVFLHEGTAYGEFDVHFPEMISDAFNLHMQEDIEYTPKAEGLFNSVAPMATTILSDYQKLSLIDFYNKYVEIIEFDDDSFIQPTPIDLSMINADFFESDEYQMVVSFVEALGLEISEIKDGVAKFDLDITGAKVKSFLKMIGQDKIATVVNALLPNDVSLLKISVSVDLANARLTQISVATDEIETIGNVALAYAALNLPENAELGISSVKGAISLTIDVTYDADVDAVALPKEDVEYVISD